jgi:hypothetical protein
MSDIVLCIVKQFFYQIIFYEIGRNGTTNPAMGLVVPSFQIQTYPLKIKSQFTQAKRVFCSSSKYVIIFCVLSTAIKNIKGKNILFRGVSCSVDFDFFPITTILS